MIFELNGLNLVSLILRFLCFYVSCELLRRCSPQVPRRHSQGKLKDGWVDVESFSERANLFAKFAEQSKTESLQ